MQPLSNDEIKRIAKQHKIRYRALDDPDPLVVRTRISRSFPISQKVAFESFADPVAHVPLFPILKGATPPIRSGIEGLLGKNQFLVFEHVQESNLPPRLMVVKYTLKPPSRIEKVAATDPFLAEDKEGILGDRKNALVRMDFKKIARKETEIVATSSFKATTGAIFARGFIDRVWLNFFERMMVVNGQLAERDMQT
jgi:hypothetical protein